MVVSENLARVLPNSELVVPRYLESVLPAGAAWIKEIAFGTFYLAKVSRLGEGLGVENLITRTHVFLRDFPYGTDEKPILYTYDPEISEVQPFVSAQALDVLKNTPAEQIKAQGHFTDDEWFCLGEAIGASVDGSPSLPISFRIDHLYRPVVVSLSTAGEGLYRSHKIGREEFWQPALEHSWLEQLRIPGRRMDAVANQFVRLIEALDIMLGQKLQYTYNVTDSDTDFSANVITQMASRFIKDLSFEDLEALGIELDRNEFGLLQSSLQPLSVAS